MVTYTFNPKASTFNVNWDDPTVWVGHVVPNAANADVVFPLVTTVATGQTYISNITIKSSESYVADSVSVTGDYLEIAGSLTISGALTLNTESAIGLEAEHYLSNR